MPNTRHSKYDMKNYDFPDRPDPKDINRKHPYYCQDCGQNFHLIFYKFAPRCPDCGSRATLYRPDDRGGDQDD